MDDIGDVVCVFCGSIMELSREIPASADTHALLFFTCVTCGASELRIERGATESNRAERDSWARNGRSVRSG